MVSDWTIARFLNAFSEHGYPDQSAFTPSIHHALRHSAQQHSRPSQQARHTSSRQRKTRKAALADTEQASWVVLTVARDLLSLPLPTAVCAVLLVQSAGVHFWVCVGTGSLWPLVGRPTTPNRQYNRHGLGVDCASFFFADEAARNA